MMLPPYQSCGMRVVAHNPNTSSHHEALVDDCYEAAMIQPWLNCLYIPCWFFVSLWSLANPYGCSEAFHCWLSFCTFKSCLIFVFTLFLYLSTLIYLCLLYNSGFLVCFLCLILNLLQMAHSASESQKSNPPNHWTPCNSCVTPTEQNSISSALRLALTTRHIQECWLTSVRIPHG